MPSFAADYTEREREINDRPDPIKRNLLRTMGFALMVTGVIKSYDMCVGISNTYGTFRGGTAYVHGCRWGNYAASVHFDLVESNSSCYLDTSICNPSYHLAEKTIREYTTDKVYSLYSVRGTNKCILEQERVGWMVASVLFLVIGVSMGFVA